MSQSAIEQADKHTTASLRNIKDKGRKLAQESEIGMLRRTSNNDGLEGAAG